MNSNSNLKWEKVTNQIKGLSYEYNYPMILYIDINSDVQGQTFIEFENKRKAEGWMIHKSSSWTRKSTNNPKKPTTLPINKTSNIDIIMTKHIYKEIEDI